MVSFRLPMKGGGKPKNKGRATKTTPTRQQHAQTMSILSMGSFRNTRASMNVTIGDVKISADASPSGRSVKATNPDASDVVPESKRPSRFHCWFRDRPMVNPQPKSSRAGTRVTMMPNKSWAAEECKKWSIERRDETGFRPRFE